jgi:acetoin utilization protein AcuB
MEARKLMSLEIVTVPPELSLEAAHRIMLDRTLRHLPVVAGTKLAGILSDRDLLLAIGKAKDGSFVYPKVTVGEVMSLAPISAAPTASVAELAKAMLDAKIDAIPVVSREDALIGLVTSTDLMRLLLLLPKETQPQFDFQIRRAADLQARA